MSFQPEANESNICPGCREPVLASWKACPSCATKLGAASAEAPIVQAGDHSVVKAQIDRSTSQGPATGAGSGSRPMIQSGEGSVIKAEINASTNTNVHNDRSLKVNGQFVANQTVVNESSVGSLVRMVMGAFSSTSAQEIEASLPDTAPELFAVLAQTLNQVTRQEKLEFKRQRNLFGSAKVATTANPMREAQRKYKEAAERHQLCQKILDRLHGIGQRSRNKQLVGDIEKLDNCLMDTVSITKTNGMFPNLKGFGWMFAIGGVLATLLFLAGLLSFKAEPIGFGFILMLITIGPLVGGYYYFRNTVAKQEAKIASVEKNLDELLSRYTA